jgi:hypothetical protein
MERNVFNCNILAMLQLKASVFLSQFEISLLCLLSCSSKFSANLSWSRSQDPPVPHLRKKVWTFLKRKMIKIWCCNSSKQALMCHFCGVSVFELSNVSFIDIFLWYLKTCSGLTWMVAAFLFTVMTALSNHSPCTHEGHSDVDLGVVVCLWLRNGKLWGAKMH